MEREQALRMLSAFRWELTNTPKPEVEDLTEGQEHAEGTRHICIDSRNDPRADHLTGKGTYFLSAGGGAAIPPWFINMSQNNGQADMRPNPAALQTIVNLGYGNNHIENTDTIIIEGHTHCGANEAMVKALLSNTPQDAGFETQWMYPIATEAFQTALREADAHGADRDTLLRMVEQFTVLQSMRHLYDYHFNDHNVRDLVNRGELQIIGAIKGFAKDKDGHQPLYIFDPETQSFHDIRELYEAFGSPSFKELERFRSDVRSQIIPKADTIPISSPVELVIQQGANSKTIAELMIDDLDTSIQQHIQNIQQAGSYER